MSYQRAYVNCMRCHQLAQTHRQPASGGRDNVLDLERVLKDESLWNARNEAMKLISRSDPKICYPLLNACMDCNYSEPKIAKKMMEFKEEIYWLKDWLERK